MAESFVQLDADGTGKKLHSFDRTIGANTVHDEVVILGEPYLASYVVRTTATSTATANSHLIQLMAGASLKLRIRRIVLQQFATATTADAMEIRIHRLTTAGSGGTAAGIDRLDPSDSAESATAESLPTTKGTEGDMLAIRTLGMTATEPPNANNTMIWEPAPGSKPIIVAAGTANGIAVKNITAIAAGTVTCEITYDEVSF